MNKNYCGICDLRTKFFKCEATGRIICQWCCDKYQLNQETKGWRNYFEQSTNGDKQPDYIACLNCAGLTREVSEDINTMPEDGFGYCLINFEYKGKKVFSNDLKELNVKREHLISKLGCDDVNDYFALGETQYFLHKYPEALETFKKVEELVEDKTLYKYMGLTCMHLRKLDLSEYYFRQAVRVDDSFSCVYRHLGDLCQIQHKYEDSVFYYRQALNTLGIDEDGSYDIITEFNYYGLTLAYSKLGLHEKVIDVASEFLDVYGPWESIEARVAEHRDGKFTNLSDVIDVEAVATILQLMSMSFLEKDDLDNANNYIQRAKWLCSNDPDIARVEGILIGRKYNDDKLTEYKELLNNVRINAEERLMKEIVEIRNAIEKQGKSSAVDLLELKPNVMGIGVNINEFIKRFNK